MNQDQQDFKNQHSDDKRSTSNTSYAEKDQALSGDKLLASLLESKQPPETRDTGKSLSASLQPGNKPPEQKFKNINLFKTALLVLVSALFVSTPVGIYFLGQNRNPAYQETRAEDEESESGGLQSAGLNSATDNFSARCQMIKVYKLEEKIFDMSSDPPINQLSDLTPNDMIQIAVAPTDPQLTTQGRIRVNSAAWSVTTEKNKFGEYYIDFAIPAGVKTFTFESEVYVDGQWK